MGNDQGRQGVETGRGGGVERGVSEVAKKGRYGWTCPISLSALNFYSMAFKK